jgi:hypothetical protein
LNAALPKPLLPDVFPNEALPKPDEAPAFPNVLLLPNPVFVDVPKPGFAGVPNPVPAAGAAPPNPEEPNVVFDGVPKGVVGSFIVLLPRDQMIAVGVRREVRCR